MVNYYVIYLIYDILKVNKKYNNNKLKGMLKCL